MIRTNLSTRPFYNERAIRGGCSRSPSLAAAATAFNVSRVLRYSRSDTRLATQASRDEARAAELRAEAARLRASVDPHQIDFASADARQANELIDRRTSSRGPSSSTASKRRCPTTSASRRSPKIDAKTGTICSPSPSSPGASTT